jgi:hypothetical protein
LKTELTAQRLRELFHYDPETGVFTRLATRRTDRVGARAATRHSNGYIRFTVDARHQYAHRLAWLYVHGRWPSGDIDHINHDKRDNRIANLRDVSRSVNAQNQIAARSNNRTSGVLGVSWNKSAGKWGASIQVESRLRHLGLFSSVDEARAAYLTAKRALHPGCPL